MKTLSVKFALTALCSMMILAPHISEAITVINGAKNSGGLLAPTGKGWGEKSAHPLPITNNASIPQNGIYYHGGPVLGTTSRNIPHIYYIWYGNWQGNTAINLLANLALGIGKTYNFNINSTYTDRRGYPVQRIVTFPLPGIFDNYSQGTALTDKSVLSIVTNAVDSKKLPLDAHGIYFVLTSADVDETSGFCTTYCGWHAYGKVHNQTVQYAFVGNAERCPAACSAQHVSPNDNLGADAMANVITHELEESITDPHLNAWYDLSGEENADKCAWQFGSTYVAPNGSHYNMTIAYKHYLVQMNWLNANGGKCVNGLNAG